MTLLAALYQSGVKFGLATSVKKAVWDAAEAIPRGHNSVLALSDEQRVQLRLFGGP